MRRELLVLTGTAFWGFDELVAAADRAAARLGLPGLAQIGGGRVRPRHLDWVRFLPEAELRARLARRPLVVTHGGMGLLGDAMRAGCRIVAVPRRGPTRRRNPANDQTALLERLARLHPIRVCGEPEALEGVLAEVLRDPGPDPVYRLESDVPAIVRAFLARTAADAAPRRRLLSAAWPGRRRRAPDPG